MVNSPFSRLLKFAHQFFNNLLNFFIQSWHESKLLFFIEMFGALTGIIAASLMAFMAPNPPFLLAFILYNVSAILILYISVKKGAPFTALLMVFYLIITTIGIFNLF